MTRQSEKQLVLDYIEQVWNRADAAALTRLTTDEFTFRLGNRAPRDVTAMREFLQDVHTAFPDWRVQVRDLVIDRDSAVARWDGVVTHAGPFQGIPATGRPIKVCGINWYRTRGGKIDSEWEQTDSLDMLVQIGIVPADRSPEAGAPQADTR